ncbi:prepilin peptidase [Thalassiella azotivora]
MTALVVALCAVLGLAVGSFLNVVVWRVPRGESVVSPASGCPRCGHPIRPRDNVPVLSWLLLRGRCRDCHAPISVRYPLVELGTAAAFAGVAWWAGPSWHLPAFLYLAAVSVALALIDLDVHRLPNAIVLPSYVVGAVLLGVPSLLGGEPGQLVRTALGGVVLYAAYFALALAYPSGMGFGDVKLAGVLGGYLAWVGWPALAVGGFAAFLLGGLFSAVLVVLGRAGRKTKVPFGPFMLAGAWVGLLAGERVADGYLGLVGL